MTNSLSATGPRSSRARREVLVYPCRLQAERSAAVRAAATTDPVCGMKVDPQHALTGMYRRRTYHFCSVACRDAFRRDPTSGISR